MVLSASRIPMPRSAVVYTECANEAGLTLGASTDYKTLASQTNKQRLDESKSI